MPTKVLIEDGCVWYLKRCREHGVQKTKISDDVTYWQSQKMWLKPGDRPLAPQTRTEHGCPFDCGLCPDHEQHSCLAIVEINQACNLACPVCFANATDVHGSHLPLATIEGMLDTLVASEGEPDLVQLSGGEPTIHPQFFEILEAVKRRPIRHVMINTNGVRIAQDREFVARLASYAPRLEVYLQFDSLDDDALVNLRGAKLSHIRQQALENLEAVGLSTTLVVVVKKGINDREVPSLIQHALKWSCVRGVTLQPVQDAGRNEGFDGKTNRILPMRTTTSRREIGRLYVGRHDPAAVQSRSNLHWLRPTTRLDRDANHVAAAARPDPARPQHHQLRSLPCPAGRHPQPAEPRDIASEHRRKACEPALLPASRDGPVRTQLRQQLPRRHPAIPGSLQL